MAGRLEEVSLLHGPSRHISAPTLAHPMGGMRGIVSLMAAATMSEGHTGVPSRAGSEDSPGTNLIGPGAEDLDENCLVRAQTLHCLVQLPGIVFTGAVQKG